MNSQDLIRLLLPEGLTEYFEITKVDKAIDSYTICLEEKNAPPDIATDGKLVSKGFYGPIVIQDFPLRGKACFLKVKRRRWTDQSTGKAVSRDWDIVAKGTRITKEFASFLKAINR